MARKTYKELLEDQVKLAERIEKMRDEEALKIGRYVLDDIENVDTFGDFKEYLQGGDELIKKLRFELKKLRDENTTVRNSQPVRSSSPAPNLPNAQRSQVPPAANGS